MTKHYIQCKNWWNYWWVADRVWDPWRTVAFQNRRIFDTFEKAQRHLKKINKKYPLRNLLERCEILPDAPKDYPISYEGMMDICKSKTGENKYTQCKIWHWSKETIWFVYQSVLWDKEILNVCYQQLAFHPSKPSIYTLWQECYFSLLPE